MHANGYGEKLSTFLTELGDTNLRDRYMSRDPFSVSRYWCRLRDKGGDDKEWELPWHSFTGLKWLYAQGYRLSAKVSRQLADVYYSHKLPKIVDWLRDTGMLPPSVEPEKEDSPIRKWLLEMGGAVDVYNDDDEGQEIMLPFDLFG